MKAETYFKKEYGTGHIPMVMAEEDLVSMYLLIDEFSKEYAKIQIENDRESIKKDMPDVVKAMINAVPINLD